LKLSLPDTLLSIVNTGVAINRAELVFTHADDPTSSTFSVPTAVRVLNTLPDWTSQFTEDIESGTDYFGGSLDEESGTYRFNIGRYIQSLLHPDTAQRQEGNGLFLELMDQWISAGRLPIKNGPGDIKLIITYTPLN
jgi:hypothetical protein